MSQKRPQRGEGCSSDDLRPRKLPSFKRVVLDALNLHRFQQLTEPVLEPLIRRVVKEEVDLALRKYSTNMKRNCVTNTHCSESRTLQFLNAISIPVFTGTRIEGEGCNNLAVALFDAHTGKVVSCGPESSGKVEIVVLEGDFDGDEGDNWTSEDFKNNIVREREGKKSLLTGDTFVILKDGIAPIEDISLTDNSSWTRSRKFRLGARLIENTGGARVKEAKSEAFIVRDHRGELYKKHHPPSLSDEVWRLEKIGKDGAFHKRLRKERVNTVQDFLCLLFLDPTRLRSILGSGMPPKMWDVMVEHARTCVLDKKLYLYDASQSQQQNGVVFNLVGQVMGTFSNGQYISADNLSESEKADARELVISAFKDKENILVFYDESSLNTHASSSCLSTGASFQSLSLEDSYLRELISQRIDESTYSLQNLSSPDFMQSVYNIHYPQGVEPMEIGIGQNSSFPNQETGSLIYNTDSMAGAFRENVHTQFGGTDFSLQGSGIELSSDLRSCMDALLPASAVPVDQTQSRWNILLSLLRWRFSIRRMVARKNRVRDRPEMMLDVDTTVI
ncbi:calmodulin-binding protein 60 A-like isoform X1 [Primulina tabacum]|uniref:calmodulin-binding protein 60 A-like isoform X1 n=1 Tax=Primulina tabacum TaxID=48773 RepID=UPI003F597922